MMDKWTGLMSKEAREKRGRFSKTLIANMDPDCLTRKPRDPEKRELIYQLGLPDRYREVQYPSPGNTPDDLDDFDI